MSLLALRRSGAGAVRSPFCHESTSAKGAPGFRPGCRRTGMGSAQRKGIRVCARAARFDTADFVSECRHMQVTPHVAQNNGRRGGSALDQRTTRYAGYGISQKKRKRIEECFGWLKTIALLRKVRHRGLFKVDWVFTFACAAYNPGAPAQPVHAGAVSRAAAPIWCRSGPKIQVEILTISSRRLGHPWSPF
jgi:hypothetical protein